MKIKDIVPDVILYEFINKMPYPKEVMMFGYNFKSRNTISSKEIDVFSGIGNVDSRDLLKLRQKESYDVTEISHEIPVLLRIFGVQIIVSNPTQFANPIYICRESPNGARERRVFQPLNYRSAASEITDSVYVLIDKLYKDHSHLECLIYDDIYIQTVINPNTKVEFRFGIDEKIHESMKHFYHSE